MKTLQLQNVWTAESVLDGTGQRRLTIARGLPQPAPRRRVASRRNGVMKLTVASVPAERSGFAPDIRIGS